MNHNIIIAIIVMVGVVTSMQLVDGSIPPANTWRSIFVNSDNVTAQTTFDTLTFVEGTGMTITPDFANSEITFTSSGGGGATVNDPNFSCPGTDMITDISLNNSTGVWTITCGSGSGTPDRIAEGNSSVEVVDLGTGYVDVDLDGVNEYHFNSTYFDVKSNTITGVNYIETDAGTVASIGTVRMPCGDAMGWRNGADTNNNYFYFSCSDGLTVTINGVGEYQYLAAAFDMTTNYIQGSMGCVDGQMIQYDSSANRWQCRTYMKVLTSAVTANNPAAYVAVITTPALTINQGNSFSANLIVSSDTAGVAPQFRTLFGSAGNTGFCTYVNPDTATTFSIDNIAIGATDTAETVWLPGANIPITITVNCSVMAGATGGVMQLQFQPEVAGTVKVHAGSWYTFTP